VTLVTGGLEIVLAQQRLWLLPQHAVYWEEQHTLLIADVHLGKASSFRSLGVPVPSGTTEQNLHRLSELLALTQASKLVVLGDLIHARASQTPALHQQVFAWRQQHPELNIVLVRGNHDDSAGDPPQEWSVDVVNEPYKVGSFSCYHAPPETNSKLQNTPWMAGHIHPVINIRGGANDRARLPCFVRYSDGLLLPAFGEFTGGFDIAKLADKSHVEIHPIAGRIFTIGNK
jgi:uncharacterized protein